MGRCTALLEGSLARKRKQRKLGPLAVYIFKR